MDITPLIPKGRQVITGYGDGGFKINGQFIQGSLIVFPDHSEAWDVIEKTFLTVKHLQAVIEAKEPLELLLVGTGGRFYAVAPEIKDACKKRNFSLEIMDTGAACRTYNVLMSEERRVAAALVAV